MVGLAREIAMDMEEVDVILKNHNVTPAQFEKISKDLRFVAILQSCVIEWTSATNTEQRIKLKSAYMLEGWLAEANSRLHDTKENLAAKVELAKFLGRLNNLGLGTHAPMAGDGEKFSITINLGAGDDKVKFEKVVAPKVIEHNSEGQ